MTTEFQVSLYEGKYTYERDDDGQQRALRYGEPWRDLVGDKFVAAMGYEIERLQELLIDDSRLRDDLIKAEKEIERLRNQVEMRTGLHRAAMDGRAVLVQELAESQARQAKLLDALQALLRRDERNTCQHDTTHRGGAQWEICDLCGAQWADDEGGRPEWKEPQEWVDAREALAKLQEFKS